MGGRAGLVVSLVGFCVVLVGEVYILAERGDGFSPLVLCVRIFVFFGDKLGLCDGVGRLVD